MIYTEVWQYLTDLFGCPVIQGLQNNNPLPHDCIVMTLMPFIQDLDKPSYFHDGDKSGSVSASKQYMMQLDFYGENALDRAVQVATVWRSVYTTERLKSVQPLFSNQVMNMTHVNEQNQYEKRFLLEVALQYNPSYEFQEQGISISHLEIKPIID